MKAEFDFDEEAWQRLLALQQQYGAATPAIVVRNALRLYEWIMGLGGNATIQVIENGKISESHSRDKLISDR